MHGLDWKRGHRDETEHSEETVRPVPPQSLNERHSGQNRDRKPTEGKNRKLHDTLPQGRVNTLRLADVHVSGDGGIPDLWAM